MTREEYEALLELRPQEPDRVPLSAFADLSDRTLIYGYTLERQTVHIYMIGGKIQVVHPNPSFQGRDLECLPFMVLPTKRAYPECCDAEACRLIASHGGYVCFTTFNDDRTAKQFYGPMVEAESR